MSCKNIGPPLMVKDFGNDTPRGNTYEITISPHDHIIVTVLHPEFKRIKAVTKISPLGISCETGEQGRIAYKADFSIRPLEE